MEDILVFYYLSFKSIFVFFGMEVNNEGFRWRKNSSKKCQHSHLQGNQPTPLVHIGSVLGLEPFFFFF